MVPAPKQSADNHPTVSIVIPTCNRRDVLERCLDALARQTYRSFEIIVVDDCSSDDTPDYLERFADRHPSLQFRRIRNEKHAGANPSRNRGIDAALGEYVSLIDCDTIAHEDWLEKLIAGFDSERIAAVNGRVDDLPPGNIYELTLKGTHRVHGKRRAGRLVAGNVCIRRDALLKCRLDEDRSSQPSNEDGTPDVSVSGRGDEEGLFLRLRAAGYEQVIAHDAVVLHDHAHSRRSFFRLAFRSGVSAARLVYKYHLPPRLDMLPFILAYATLPLGLIDPRLLLIAAFFFAGALAAITYNDLFRKKKTLGETIITFPLLLAYYHLRLIGYVSQSIRLRTAPHEIHRVRLTPPT